MERIDSSLDDRLKSGMKVAIRVPVTLLTVLFFVIPSVTACTPTVETSTPESTNPAPDVIPTPDGTSNSTVAPITADELIKRGITQGEEGHYADAIKEFDQAIELEPDNPLIYFSRGRVNLDHGTLEQAVSDFGEAIRLKPDYFDAYLNRGIAFRELGKYDRSSTDISRAIHLNPESALAYYERGLTNVDDDSRFQGQEAFSEAIRLDPQYAEAYFKRGNAYLQMHEYDKGIEDLSQAIRLGLINATSIITGDMAIPVRASMIWPLRTIPNPSGFSLTTQ
jgi:tetratricopeptide (TPR) repeat protein